MVGVLRYAINPLRSPDNRTESLPSTRIFHTENFPLRNYVLLANAKNSSRSTLCYRNHWLDCVLRRVHVTDATRARTILFRRFAWIQLSDTNCANDFQTFLLSILRKRSQSLTFYLCYRWNIGVCSIYQQKSCLVMPLELFSCPVYWKKVNYYFANLINDINTLTATWPYDRPRFLLWRHGVFNFS